MITYTHDFFKFSNSAPFFREYFNTIYTNWHLGVVFKTKLLNSDKNYENITDNLNHTFLIQKL